MQSSAEMGDELDNPFWFIVIVLIFVGKTKVPAEWVSLEHFGTCFKSSQVCILTSVSSFYAEYMTVGCCYPMTTESMCELRVYVSKEKERVFFF